MSFDHEYYTLNDQLKETVFCMKCAFPVKKPDYTKEDVKKYYNEVKVKWTYGDKIVTDGVIITCPDCKDFQLSDEEKPKILNQVIQALELQMRKTEKKEDEINNLKNLFSNMKLVGRA